MRERLTRREVLVGAGAAGATVATIGGTLGALALTERTAPGALLVRSVGRRGASAAANPNDGTWSDVPSTTASVLAQQLVPPSLETAGLATLDVQSVHDETTLAFRLRWEDSTLDDLDGVDRYHDGVAIMLPTTSGKAPSITMGATGTPVHILQWRATWQRDLAGKTGVDQIYPRVIHDVMPDDVLPAAVAAEYWVGRKAGNPLSQVVRRTAVEQVIAEGFGTTTHQPVEDAHGIGVHDGAGWRVAITVPRIRPGRGAPLRGGPWHVAFAVWLGDRRNRGGRKHYVEWLPLVLDEP